MSQDLPNLQRIDLNDIIVRDRLRDVDQAEVAKLKLSIADQGLQAPVVVRPAKAVDPKDQTKFLPHGVDGYILVSGGHRFHAVRDLGWTDIPAIIVDPKTPLEARLLEIDENLYRHELNALDRAVFVFERKTIY
jgi:ParB family transcriptional regulator, chromosome partitioning protein